MNSSAICHVLPGFVAPEEYLKLASTRCPTAFGFMGREGNGKLVMEAMTTMPPLSELKELNEALKSSHLVMWFGNLPKAKIPDDIQPWSLNDGAEEPKHWLLMMYEGNFDKWTKTAEGHTGEYGASDEVIFPRLQKAFNDSDQNVDKFLELLRGSALQTSLCNSFDKRGTFVFLGPTGDPIAFGENDSGGKYTWGSVSQSFGYKETTVAKQATAAVKTGMNFLRGRSSTATVDPAATPSPAPAPAPDAPHPDANPDIKHIETPDPSNPKDGDTKVEDGVTLTCTFPPPKLSVGSKAYNLWVRSFSGGALDEQKSKRRGFHVWVPTELRPFATRDMASKGDVEHMVSEISKFKKAQSGADVNKDMKQAHEMAEAGREILLSKGAKPITDHTKPVREKFTATSPSDFLPTMTDAEKERAMTSIGTYLDPKNEKRPSPQEIQAGEAKWPTFSEATGVTFEELLFLPVKTLTELCDGNKIAVCMIIEFRRKFIEASGIDLKALVGTKGEEPKVTKTVEKPAAQAGGKLAFLRGKSAA